jgi:hypothetical protein
MGHIVSEPTTACVPGYWGRRPLLALVHLLYLRHLPVLACLHQCEEVGIAEGAIFWAQASPSAPSAAAPHTAQALASARRPTPTEEPDVHDHSLVPGGEVELAVRHAWVARFTARPCAPSARPPVTQASC